MKRFLGLILLVFGFQSCDDGDFNVESFDFSNVTASACSGSNNQFFIYYTNQREALLLQIPITSFPNIITPEDEPRTVAIAAGTQVTYRVYDGTINSQVICTAIPPATPTVSEEWTATSGVIQIETFANKTIDETIGQALITGYTHIIKLINTTFEKSNGSQQLFAELQLGNFITNASPPSTIIASSELSNCGNNLSFIYKNGGTQAITLYTDVALFENSNTPADMPRKAIIGQDNTSINYNLYDAIIPIPNNAIIPTPLSFFCTNPTPTTPARIENWIGVDGIANVSGVIEVTSIEEFDSELQQNVFKHTVRLRKVVFTSAGVNFTFGDLYELGVLKTVP
ncbi:hypothetical protein [Flavobacterium orientale]|uniref:Lipoprotein n=1 Tax=Flavobacterium orientale TaxID=1756020 RepID=A0A916Y6Z7_9FLAO|nr:hypothetical protein [Flavobacterium orientale]GGD32935.1 hypothetical protein GCM10011343_23700 [Flavobacterium orientale]